MLLVNGLLGIGSDCIYPAEMGMLILDKYTLLGRAT